MKTVCSRHGYAYEVSQGCPWCEPPVAKESTRRVVGSQADLQKLYNEPCSLRITYLGVRVAESKAVCSVKCSDKLRVTWEHTFKLDSNTMFTMIDGVSLLDGSGQVVGTRDFRAVNLMAGISATINFMLEF
jgi:hypothetical protein